MSGTRIGRADVDPEDFLTEKAGGWGLGRLQRYALNTALVEELRLGTLPNHSDLEAAAALTHLLFDDLTAFGTSGGERLTDEEFIIAVKGHRTVLARLGLEAPRFPFRHFSGFRDYWIRNDMSGGGGWQKRRECVEGLLGPTRDALEELEEIEYERRFRKGPTGTFKNLIFAADGPKPKIVLRDAVNNDVEIVQNAEYCLVYSDPLPPHGLSWRQLVAWWTRINAADPDEVVSGRSLYARLYASLDSEPERTLFRAYCARYAGDGGFELPALIPQVYLHYDPYTRRDPRSAGALNRQRMDFLLLSADRSRIVIEVDGVQHYGTPNRSSKSGYDASPRLYSEMVAEDRRLRLAGYEVYRLGGWELTQKDAQTMLSQFFDELLKRHARSS